MAIYVVVQYNGTDSKEDAHDTSTARAETYPRTVIIRILIIFIMSAIIFAIKSEVTAAARRDNEGYPSLALTKRRLTKFRTGEAIPTRNRPQLSVV